MALEWHHFDSCSSCFAQYVRGSQIHVQTCQQSKPREDGNREALQLEGHTTSLQSSWAVPGHFVLRMRTTCHFTASDRNSDVAISWRFSDPNFLTDNNNLAIKQRFHAVILTFNIWPWKFVVGYACHVVKLCTKYERNRTIHNWVIGHLVKFHTISPRVKIRGQVDDMSEWWYLWYNFCAGPLHALRDLTYSLTQILGTHIVAPVSQRWGTELHYFGGTHLSSLLP